MSDRPADHPVWRPYTQMKRAAPPPEVISSDGVRLTRADGRVLLDGMASWWTACHGYNHPHIRAAVERQLASLPHVMFGGLTHAPAETLARRLAALLPGDLNHVFFSDSGSVAVEVAMKMAVQAAINRGERGRTRFLAFRDGYHGDTLGAMSVCDPDSGMHVRLGAWVPTQIIADLPRDAESLARFETLMGQTAPTLAAVILEPLVQGAGGMRFHGPETVRAVAESCRRRSIPLILDEIFTGFGRTGTMFACERAGIVPDIICLSKALTGGTITLAATIARTPIFEAFWSDDAGAALMHGPTFMANPLACAAANASLDLFETEPRLAQVAAIEAGLRDGLEPCRNLPGVVDVRVMGAIGVVQLDRPAPLSLRHGFLDAGCWIRPLGDVVYLTPAFTIEPRDLETLCAVIRAGLTSAT